MDGRTSRVLAMAAGALLLVPWMHFPYPLSEDLGGSGGPERYAVQEAGLAAAGTVVVGLLAALLCFGLRAVARRPGATAEGVVAGAGVVAAALLLFLYHVVVWFFTWGAYETV